jgi:hypothetical protein
MKQTVSLIFTPSQAHRAPLRGFPHDYEDIFQRTWDPLFTDVALTSSGHSIS